jgi:glycine/D-amino acid oxidase-like deaminating enzyme
LSADVIVIGGGIVGVSTAYHLSRRGVSVALLEKGRIAGEQSGRNWGFIRRQGRDPAEIGLAARANALYAALEDELGEPVGWVRAGNLRVAEDEAKMDQYRRWFADTDAGRTLGTRLVSGADIRELLPQMQPDWVGGIYTAEDGHADPERVTRAIAAAAATSGAAIEQGVTVVGVECSGDRVTGVRTTEGRRSAGVVVCAAGIWTDRLLRPHGVSLPVRWVRGTVAATRPLPMFTDLAVWTPRVAFRQRRDGSVILGTSGLSDFDITLDSVRHIRQFLPNYLKNWRLFRFHVGRMFLEDLQRRIFRRSGGGAFQWTRASDPPPNPVKIRRSRAEFARLFPSLPQPRVDRSWAGYIDATPDGLPAIGELERPTGLFVASGFSGHGFGLGTAVGATLSELIHDGHSQLDLSALRPERFAEPGRKITARSIT